MVDNCLVEDSLLIFQPSVILAAVQEILYFKKLTGTRMQDKIYFK